MGRFSIWHRWTEAAECCHLNIGNYRSLTIVFPVTTTAEPL